MDKQALKHTLLKYLEAVSKHSAQISPHFDAEVIHKFRTSVKKLRAILSLQKEFDSADLPHSFKSVYHCSGAIRDAQVQLSSLVAHNHSKSFSPFAIWLATHIGYAQRDWDKHYHHDAVKDLKHYIDHLSLNILSIEELAGFFQHALHQIITKITTIPNDEHIHEARRQIKELMYIADWCEENWPDGHDALKPHPTDRLKQLSELTGNYNDERIGLTLFESYLSSEKDEEASANAHQEQAHWLQQKNRIRQHVIDAIREFAELD